MKNSIVAVVLCIIVFISGCAGYFEYSTGSELQANSLAIENGGGYLSGPSNDITPFLYRDTNGNNPVLFFSSDRDGTYDIYYAVMNQDGTFQIPVKMTNVSSDLSNEFAPVVHYVFDNYTADYYLSIAYVREMSSNTVLELQYLNSSLQPTGLVDSYSPGQFICSVDLENTNYAPSMLLSISDGRTNLTSAYYDAGPGFWSTGSTVYIPTENVYSTASVRDSDSNWTSVVRIIESEYQNKRQLFLYYDYTQSSPAYFNRYSHQIHQYASSYNDRWPYIDFKEQGKLYFSSDRGINNDYDLFRYNNLTYFEVVPQNPFQ